MSPGTEPPLQHGSPPEGGVLRVRSLPLPGEGAELLTAAAAHRLDELRVRVADEIRKRRGLPVFLAHEQEGKVWGQQDRGGQELQGLEGQQGRGALAEQAVADLVVILAEHHEALEGQVGGGVPVASAAVRRVPPVVDEAIPVGFDQILEAAEILVVPLPFPGEQGVQGVMKVVGPLGLQPQAAGLRGADDPGVVEVALGDQGQRPPQLPGQGLGASGKLPEKGDGAAVVEGVDRVQAQGIDAVAPEPVLGVGQEVGPHRVAVGPVEVDRLSPGSTVAVGEIGAEVPQVVPLRAQVVVHHVQDHGQALAVAGRHQLLECFGPSVGALHGVRVHAVITPVALSRELGDGHQLEGGHAEGGELGKARDHGREGALGREGAHVQLVEHHVPWGKTLPPSLVPPVGPVIHDRGGGVHALGLVVRGRVRAQDLAVQAVLIPGPRRDRLQGGAPVAAGLPLERNCPGVAPGLLSGGALQQDLHALAARGPEREVHPVAAQAVSPRLRASGAHGVFSVTEYAPPGSR